MTQPSEQPSGASEPSLTIGSTSSEELSATLARLRDSFRAAPYPSYAERRDALRSLLNQVRKRQPELEAAVDEDFGGRSAHTTSLGDIFVTVDAIRFMLANLRAWMEPEPRSLALQFQPASARLEYQPRGVVGIMSPWNYPVQLALMPLAYAIAAGNRALVKPSELTPRTSGVLAELVHEALGPDHAVVVLGGAELGKAFAALPLDYIFFTGSNRVGREVMRAAAENLTPLTLELGGKCPAVIHPDFPLETALRRVLAGKLYNGGQSCVATDYLLVQEQQLKQAIDHLKRFTAQMYPTLLDNTDYTAIINDRHFERVAALVQDARSHGASVEQVNPASEDLPRERRKFPPTFVHGVTDEMALMQEEIFAPVLPVVTFRKLEEALDYVNQRPHPLSFYYFDHDRRRSQQVQRTTLSGGLCLNDTVIQYVLVDLPFGGVGPSGMGNYHGREGFIAFSHSRGVFQQARLNAVPLLYPPFGKAFERVIKLLSS